MDKCKYYNFIFIPHCVPLKFFRSVPQSIISPSSIQEKHKQFTGRSVGNQPEFIFDHRFCKTYWSSTNNRLADFLILILVLFLVLIHSSRPISVVYPDIFFLISARKHMLWVLIKNASRGASDLFYVLPCVILFLCFSVLGNRELILVLFVRLFDLCLFGFIGFLFL